MPISVALPPPNVEVEDSWYFPVRNIDQGPFTDIDFAAAHAQRVQTTALLGSAGIWGAAGGGGSTLRLGGDETQAVGQQESAQVRTTVSAIGGGFLPYFHRMSYGPASAWTAGSRTAPANVVQVNTVSWVNFDTVDRWPDDTAGFMWIPQGSGANFVDSLRLGTTPLTGFGCFFNSDGAGGAVLEYVAWNLAVAVERVRLPAGIIADISTWNTVQFATVTAASGREATMSIEVNNVPFITDREYGSAELPLATAQSADALGYVFGFGAGSAAGFFYHFIASGYSGRFAPSGQELQTFGA